DRRDRDGRAYAAARAERPADAAARGVERIDGAVLAADEYASKGDSRLRPGGRRVGKSEGPLQRQPRDVGGGESGLLGGLQPAVRRRRAPARPSRAARGASRRRRRAASLRRTEHVVSDLFSGEVLG